MLILNLLDLIDLNDSLISFANHSELQIFGGVACNLLALFTNFAIFNVSSDFLAIFESSTNKVKFCFLFGFEVFALYKPSPFTYSSISINLLTTISKLIFFSTKVFAIIW